MVALLVLATFVLFIAVDVLLHREKYQFAVEKKAAKPVMAPVTAPVVAGVALPETISYHPGHTWARNEGNGRIRIGLDQFAASILSSVNKVEAPPRGRWVRQGAKGWTVSTAKGIAEMLSPVDGEIVAINDKAFANPSAITEDPYGEGWLIEVRSPDFAVNLRNLLTGGFARRWMEESMAALTQTLEPARVATMADGGQIMPGVANELPNEKWSAITRQFFLS